MNPEEIDWRLYVIVDPTAIAPDRTLVDVARAAIAGGAGVVQLRDKRATVCELLEEARSLARLCRDRDVAFIVNDRLDVALASGAHGVHLGPDDLPIDDARRIAPGLVLGGSAGTPQDARLLVEQGVDYLGSGAVFDASPSKPDAHHNRGVAALRRVVETVSVPVVGIGGIDVSNAAAVARTEAAGVAVIRAVCAADDSEAACRELLQAFEG